MSDELLFCSLTFHQYRDQTPSEYEPEYFCAAPSGPFPGLDKMPLVINVGSVKTNSVDMRVKFAGLESFLFEDLCRANHNTTPSSTVTPSTTPVMKGGGTGGGDLFQGVSHVSVKPAPVTVEDQSGSSLARELSKVQVTPSHAVGLSDLADAAENRQPLRDKEKEEEEVVFKKVKQFM